jgi:hypothetical protein
VTDYRQPQYQENGQQGRRNQRVGSGQPCERGRPARLTRRAGKSFSVPALKGRSSGQSAGHVAMAIVVRLLLEGDQTAADLVTGSGLHEDTVRRLLRNWCRVGLVRPVGQRANGAGRASIVWMLVRRRGP